jgi:lipoate-protein ligase A
MSEIWRMIDTGLRPAAQNIALDRALLEARAAEEIPSTLRFLRFTPSALLGYHQSAEQELDLDYCRAHGITVQRRITGGGAIFFDEAQLGWELYLHLRDVGTRDIQAIAKRICHAAATAVSALGVDARYRPRNDIEVDGRKISDTGGAFDGDGLLYQGTLLIDFDVETMLRVLRIPAEKLSGEAIASARERVASLRELLGRQPDTAKVRRYLAEAFESEFGVEFSEGDLTLTEDKRYQSALAEIDTADWVNLVARPRADMPILEAARKFPGGLLRATVTYDAVARVIRKVWFTGDIFVNPRRAVRDLEAALRDLPLDRLEAKALGFFAGQHVDLLGLAPGDFVTVVRMAVGQPLLARSR